MRVELEVDEALGLSRAFARLLAPFGERFPVLLPLNPDGPRKESVLRREFAGDHF